jgi:hypothetical protein
VFVVVVVYFVMTQSGNFWIRPRILDEVQTKFFRFKAHRKKKPTGAGHKTGFSLACAIFISFFRYGRYLGKY